MFNKFRNKLKEEPEFVWWLEPGAALKEIEAASAELNFRFPQSYAQFLHQWNGCHFHFVFYGVGHSKKNIVTENQMMRKSWTSLPELMPNLVFFANDGGEVNYAFDTRKPTTGDEYQIGCFVGIDGDDELRPIADSFPKFINEYFLKRI